MKKSHIFLLVIIVLIIFSAPFAFLFLNQQVKTSPHATFAKVIEVIDGDTFKIATGEKVRLVGIDTPELHHPKKPVQCYGKEAMEMTKKLIQGKTVRLEKDISETDTYGRLLRYVYLSEPVLRFFKKNSEIFLNAYLVQEGYARLETFPPDVSNAKLFSTLQHEAIVNRKGLWKLCQ
jgi:micrococcal nuclease